MIDFRPASPSSRGLGHHPFTVRTGVRIPVGTPLPAAARSTEAALVCRIAASAVQYLDANDPRDHHGWVQLTKEGLRSGQRARDGAHRQHIAVAQRRQRDEAEISN